jgi:rubrerythrin
MISVELFLAHSIKLEEEAALRFSQLADAMTTSGNVEVGQLFRCLARYSRMHLDDARERAGFRTLPALTQADYEWPDIESPEAASIWAADPLIGREQALRVAFEAESAGLAYYQHIAESSIDPEVRRFAQEFADEERQHVAELGRWIALNAAGRPLPADYQHMKPADGDWRPSTPGR